MHEARFKFQSHIKTVSNDPFWASSIQIPSTTLPKGGRREGGEREGKVLSLEERRKQALQAGRPWKPLRLSHLPSPSFSCLLHSRCYGNKGHLGLLELSPGAANSGNNSSKRKAQSSGLCVHTRLPPMPPVCLVTVSLMYSPCPHQTDLSGCAHQSSLPLWVREDAYSPVGMSHGYICDRTAQD